VTREQQFDSDKAIIERRYSEFLKLYKELKKSFPEFMESIKFPEKKIYGNLKTSLISERIRLLQDFVRKIHENEDIRNSEIFKTFFYVSSLQQGCQYICGGMFEQALNFLLNGLHLQQKLALDSTSEVVATLCGIVECYMSLKSYDEVVKYSNAALEMMGDDISSVYLVPLLQTLKNALAVLAENTADVERRLSEIVNRNQIEIEHLPSLRELSVKRFANK
jgi:tetratricopeptide (TPR) repeat protein